MILNKILTIIFVNLKKEKLTRQEFATLMEEFEQNAKQVEEKEEGILHEFDFHLYTSRDKSCGLIGIYRIYEDNAYSTTIVDEFHPQHTANSTSLYD